MRVQHLATVGIRRMFQAGIAKGWSAWHDMWEEKTRQQRLLKAAAARLAKPKVSKRAMPFFQQPLTPSRALRLGFWMAIR